MIEEQDGLLNEVDDSMIAELADGISDYIHGEARDYIASQIAESTDDLSEVIGAISYQIMSDVSADIGETSPEMVTFETLIPLATETIDYLIEIAYAVGAPVNDEDQVRAMAFVTMLELHMAKVGDDPEQLALAQELVAEMMDEGMMDEAESFLSEKIRVEGGDPQEVKAAGEQMLAPRQDPLTQGVRQGLMGGMQ